MTKPRRKTKEEVMERLRKAQLKATDFCRMGKDPPFLEKIFIAPEIGK